jgi:hypothetical protein
VATDSVTVERRVDRGEWVTLGFGILVPTDFVDPLPLTNGLNEYRITSASSTGSVSVGPIVQVYGDDGAAFGDPLWTWLSYGDSFENRLRLRGDVATSEKAGRQRTTQHFLGRAKPVAFVGENTDREVSVSGMLTFDRRCPVPDPLTCVYDSGPQVWRAAGNDAEVVCFRDYTGRRIFGVLSEVTVQDGIWPGHAGVGFSVTEIDFTERYVTLDAGS